MLTGIAGALMLVASIAGLLIDDLYREPESLASMLQAYDLTTLVLVVPILCGALVGVRRGSFRAELVWIGLLTAAVYTYAIYIFGAPFNDLLLVHIAVFSCAAIALVLALASLDVQTIAARFTPRTPRHSISGLLAILAIGLGGMWIYACLRFALTGQIPAGSALVEPDAIVHLGIVLDLALLIPAYAAGCVLLWRGAAWGYVLAAAVLVSGVVHQVGYLAAMPLQTNAQVPGAVAFDPLEPVIAGLFLVATLMLLGSLKEEPRS